MVLEKHNMFYHLLFQIKFLVYILKIINFENNECNTHGTYKKSMEIL